MRANVALPPRTELRGKKRGEPRCRADDARRFSAAPSMPLQVVGGAAASVHTRCAAGAGPASTWLRLCRLFPPDICVLLPPVTTSQPSCHARMAELYDLCARCGDFCGNITAHAFLSSVARRRPLGPASRGRRQGGGALPLH